MADKQAAKRLAARKNKTRTHIWYEVDTGGAIEKKDIPFDVGVMADLSGDQKRGSFREREFVEISDPGKFDDYLKKINPKLELELEFGEPGQEQVQKVTLSFDKMDVFKPGAILDQLAQQVPEVKKAKQLRRALEMLLEKVNVSPELGELVQSAMSDPSRISELAEKLQNES